MEKLILIRYGQYDASGHINEQGKEAIEEAARGVAPYVEGKTVCVLAANIPRALESAAVLSNSLSLESPVAIEELYAAEEEGRLPDCAAALSALLRIAGDSAMVLAVVSREYAETLPDYIAETSFNKKEFLSVSLERGEALVIDFQTKQIFRIDSKK